MKFLICSSMPISVRRDRPLRPITKAEYLDRGVCAYHSVKFAPLVPLDPPVWGFVLAGAVLAEVLGGFRYGVGEEMEFDPT
jgi:hypothetical protein